MKKLMMVLLTILMVSIMALPLLVATAEDVPVYGPEEPVAPAAPETEDVPTPPPDVEAVGYTWAYLGTIAGATAAVLLIVQYTKAGIDKLIKVPTRLYVYLLALVVMMGAKWFAGVTWPDVPLVLLNAVVVANAAMGLYDQTYGRVAGTT